MKTGNLINIVAIGAVIGIAGISSWLGYQHRNPTGVEKAENPRVEIKTSEFARVGNFRIGYYGMNSKDTFQLGSEGDVRTSSYPVTNGIIRFNKRNYEILDVNYDKIRLRAVR